MGLYVHVWKLCYLAFAAMVICSLINLISVEFLIYRAAAYEFFIRNINSCRPVLDIYGVRQMCGKAIEYEALRLHESGNCSLGRNDIERLIEIYQLGLKYSVSEVVNPDLVVILQIISLLACWILILIILNLPELRRRKIRLF